MSKNENLCIDFSTFPLPLWPRRCPDEREREKLTHQSDGTGSVETAAARRFAEIIHVHGSKLGSDLQRLVRGDKGIRKNNLAGEAEASLYLTSVKIFKM